MSIELWFTVAAANFAASLAPGQNVALVGSAALQAGTRGGAAAAAGILLAELAWSALALALLLGAREVSPGLFAAMQIASAMSLVWIGTCILREPAAASPVAARAGGRGIGRFALRGIWVGAANPLALVFFLSLLPGFVPDHGALANPSTVAFYVSAVLVSTAAGLAPWLLASGVLARTGLGCLFQRLSGGALIAIAGLVLWRTLG